MTLSTSGLSYDPREIELKDKPQEMLEISPKGTVPVLQLPDGKVLEESIDIMKWALGQSDPLGLVDYSQSTLKEIDGLIAINDGEFKEALDRYKYPNRYGEEPSTHWRQQGEKFLAKLEELLSNQSFLFSAKPSLADLAIFPFVRQFAHVDHEWFEHSSYPKLIKWYCYFIDSPLFTEVMEKHPLWLQGE